MFRYKQSSAAKWMVSSRGGNYSQDHETYSTLMRSHRLVDRVGQYRLVSYD